MVDRTIVESGDEHSSQNETSADSGPTVAKPTVLEGAQGEPGALDVGGAPFQKTVLEDDHVAKDRNHQEDQVIGTVLGDRFRIIREVGIGGMGVVYEAEHLILKKRFAIKSIRSEYTNHPDFQKHFDQEAKTQALLQHPNIIQVTDFIKSDDRYFLVMEYVVGQGLDTLLRTQQIDDDGMLAMVKDVLKGLGHAHSKGIIHRDIKPSNIMITPDNTAKLMDFGVSKLVDETFDGELGVVGTPAYMSPEQINRPLAMDQRSDIYSMGIVMFEMLTGKRPFDGQSHRETQRNHIHKELPQIEVNLPDSFPGIIKIVAKMLAKAPEQRYADCQELLADIEAYERQTHIECRHCKTMNRVQDKYTLKGEKCVSCGKTLSMKSKFTRIWAAGFLSAAAIILGYLFFPWSGTLSVTTTPEEAQVFIDGVSKGGTPVELSLKPGEYKVVLKKESFEEITRTVIVKKKETTALDLDLQKPDELPRLAYEAIKTAYQAASYICRDLNDLMASQDNLKIAESIGDSALMDAYRQQIAELEQNIEDGFRKYVDGFEALKTIQPEIRLGAYKDYEEALRGKGGNMASLSVVWKHFETYLTQGISKAAWEKDILNFC